MEVTCKTLQNQRRIKLWVEREAKVGDLIEKLRVELGEHNYYRLVSVGQLMQEDDLLTKYMLSDLLPIIVMITSQQELFQQEMDIR